MPALIGARRPVILGAVDKTIFVPTSARFIFDGDSISSQTDGRSLAGHMMVESGGLMPFVPNYFIPPGDASRVGTIGVSGKKFADQTANIASAFVANPSTTHVILHCGTNDLSPTPLSQMKTDFTAYCAAWNALGVKVIYSAILKATTTTALNNEAKRIEFNTWAASQVGTNGLIAVVNHDTNFDPVADPSIIRPASDLLHPTFKGARIVARNLLGILRFQSTSLASLMPTNLVTNPAISGSGGTNSGGVTGTIPAGWSMLNQTGATVVSSVGVEDGLNYVEMLCSGTPTQTSQIRFSRNETALNLTDGQWTDGKMTVSISNAANDGDAVGVGGWMVQASNGFTFSAGHAYATDGQMGRKFKGDVRFLPLKAQAAGATGVVGFYMRVVPGSPIDIRVRVYSDIIAGKLS